MWLSWTLEPSDWLDVQAAAGTGSAVAPSGLLL